MPARPRYLARLVRPVTLRFDEIERIERQVAPRLLDHGIRIRFRLASPEIDRLQFWSWRPSMERLLAIFEDRGLEIKAVSWRDWMKT